MGLERAAMYQKYWNTTYTSAIYVAIQGAMTVVRFEQIRRFLKLNDPRSELQEIGYQKDFWQKKDGTTLIDPWSRQTPSSYILHQSHIAVPSYL